MKKTLMLALVCSFVFTQVSFAALSKHIVDYRIKAKLIPEEKAVIGEETLTWLNDSDEFVSELQFHLYLNAFKNNRSTFMKESKGIHRGFKLDKENWGYLEIRKIQIKDGPDLTSTIEYIQPDDGNKDDQTVIKVSLPDPVPPQEKITLFIEFYSKLPKVFARSGFYGDFFMVGQWFPKIGVFWNGKWNCHQYHLNTEFFADFGVYEVEITVPEEYVVGATGLRIKELENEDGTKTYTHYQEDIHDFAWTACPDFVEFREKYSLENPQVNTEMILLVHRSHLNQKDRYLSSLKNGIEFYSQNYGAYPYPTITLVDPAPKASGAGGMEYPTLFTSMTFWAMPKGLHLPEMVTIHEFGHNYWYGMIGSNEFEEAWLDEGFNTYSEIKAMEKYYGEDRSMIDMWGLKMSDFILQRFQVIGSGKMDPIVKNSWEFYSGGSYGMNTYSKAGLMLLTLENHLGDGVMSRIMRTYFERWKFKHPTTQDFVEVAEEVSGRDLGWFFDQFLYSPDKLDYAIGDIRSVLVKEPEGIFEEGKNEIEESQNREGKSQEKIYRNEVVVVRKGELIFPQEILIVFEKGEEIWEKWDGKERWRKFVYFKPYKLKSAHVDPEYKVVLDVNFINNSRILKPKKISILKYALSLMFNFQSILSFVSL
ncbi:MAG: M1 family peptidase [Candidatus Aminicenantes bacterium]|nr:MAG: M1 family peptidase [Candidatus Aminicenantes bacterium]